MPALRQIFAELKSARGRMSMPQTVWLMALGNVRDATFPRPDSGGGVEVHVWRPSDWPILEEALR